MACMSCVWIWSHFGARYRVYFGITRGVVVLLLTGGDKASQDNDIRKAVMYWNDYRRKS